MLALVSALPLLVLLLVVPLVASVGRDADEMSGPGAAVDVIVELVAFVVLAAAAAVLDCVDVVGMDSGRADVVVRDGKRFELLFCMAWERAGDEMDVGRRC